MKAITLDAFDTPPGLRELPEPEPGESEVLIRVAGSSVNPVDGAVAGGMLRGMAEYEFPVILGRDFAGTVEGAGAGVERFRVGDEVLGYLPHADPDIHAGAWCELAIAPADGGIAAKPESVSVPEAGAAILAGLTALAVVDALEVAGDETVLIIGATGGVGGFAAQLVKLAGARVIASGLPEDEEFLRALGVDEVVPRDGDVVAAVRDLEPEGADALIDTVSRSPEDLDAFAAALGGGGRAASPNSAAGEGPGRHNVGSTPDSTAAERLAGLLGDGRLTAPIQRAYPLERAAEALSDLGERHTKGKLAIELS